MTNALDGADIIGCVIRTADTSARRYVDLIPDDINPRSEAACELRMAADRARRLAADIEAKIAQEASHAA